MNEPIVFSLNSGARFARQVAKQLGVDPGMHEERDFADGEHKIRPLQSARARDVYVVQSLHGDAEHALNDKFVRLLFLAADAFVDHEAKEVVALATHGLFTGGLEKALDSRSLSHLAVSNRIPVPDLPKNSKLADKLSIVDMAPLVAETIKRLHGGKSLTELDP